MTSLLNDSFQREAAARSSEGWLDPLRGSRFQFQLFFDGDCPLCKREIDWLKKKDSQQRILFTDIAEAEFSAEHYGKNQDQLMSQIHGRMPEGDWTIGPETFRRLYGVLGWGWMVNWTAWPILRHGVDAAYWLFAKNRLRITGRWQKSCSDQACDLNSGSPVKDSAS